MKMEDVMDNSALKGELINGLAEAFNETQNQKSNEFVFNNRIAVADGVNNFTG